MVVKGDISNAFQEDLIGQIRLQRSIGISWDEDYDEKQHDVKDRTTDEHDGSEIVKGCVHWLFRTVSILRAINHHWIVVFNLI